MENRDKPDNASAETRPGAVPGNGKSLDRYLGNVIRELRLKDNLTIAEVAAQAGISRGMVSKIENGQVSTSLETLSKIAQALGVSLAHLFRHYNMPSGGAQLVKNGEGMEVVRRGTRRGHTYHLLAYDQGPKKTFEPFLITMDDASEVFPTFEHPGTEFIHMFKGRIEYRHGQHTYVLEPGDSLTFRGDIPHGPERLLELPIHFLSIIIYGGQGGE
ncbi:MAG TPA: XRE family transcriptional regulator [Burkholderiales bacterium]|jgi:transcriptional regulator with XRE-family HTH domain|nr:XRE family transcriptional regulator [Burkholderiales bacterium]